MNQIHSGTVTTVNSVHFVTNLRVTHNFGTVVFIQTSGSTHLNVLTSGRVATTGSLAAGTYTATGTTIDAKGDRGVFTFTLKVTPVKQAITVKFAVGSAVLSASAKASLAQYALQLRGSMVTVTGFSSPGVSVSSARAQAVGIYLKSIDSSLRIVLIKGGVSPMGPSATVVAMD